MHPNDNLLRHVPVHSHAGYSTYLYVEDDTRVPWPALVSWAHDTAVLAPLGYQRNFYRTEFHPETGALMLLDIIKP